MKIGVAVLALTLGATQAAGAECGDARVIWADVKTTAAQEVLSEYLEVFGECPIYGGLARERMASLTGESGAEVEEATLTEEPQDTSSKDVTLAEIYAEEVDQEQAVETRWTASERACLEAGAAPLHVEGFPGVLFSEIDPETAVPVCEAITDRLDPDPEALAAFGRVLMKAGENWRAYSVNLEADMSGSALASNSLGVMFRNGDYVDKDLEAAFFHFHQAALKGSVLGMLNLGNLYRDGEPFGRDIDRALGYYGQAAELGYGPAYDQIGWLYREGELLPRDMDKALENFYAAAELGYAKSAASVAFLRETGQHGVTMDPVEAVAWYERALAGGEFDWAAYRLGKMYLDGRGTRSDSGQAEVFFSRGAEEGHKGAERELGKLLLDRGEVDGAWIYLTRAASKGDQEASQILDRMN